MNSEILFKVKCIDIESSYLTVGEECDVVEDDEGFYKVKNDSGLTLGKEYGVVSVEGGFYTIENDSGVLQTYFRGRFEILDRESNPKDKQEFSIGDKVYYNYKDEYRGN